MKITFVTTQSPVQSTLIGRIFPIAQELKQMGHDVTLLIHRERSINTQVPNGIQSYVTGQNPFERTQKGKKRHRGLYLVWMMKKNAFKAALYLIRTRPNTIIMVKPLPENTLAVRIAKQFLQKTTVLLDVDDFELEANYLSSLIERNAIHWSERLAVRLASRIIVATPFLEDHMKLLAGSTKHVTIIPTGIPALSPAQHAHNRTILFTGSLSVSSGHRIDMLPQLLQEVQKRIPDVQMVIAGSGDDEAALREEFLIRGLTDTVKWYGRFSLHDIPELIRMSAILIDPIDASIANRAKSSFRSALALEYGIPCVTSSIGIRTDMIPQELHDRLFATPGDIQSYVEKICGLFERPLQSEEESLLTQQASYYRYDHLAKIYYNCIV